MNNEIAKLINEHMQPKDFSDRKPTVEMIQDDEAKLGIKLPAEYVEYLERYGDGGVLGIELLGAEPSGYLSFVETTMEYRKLGLPRNLVAIENCDEWLVCIDCNDGHVVNWSAYDGGDIVDMHPDFDSFLLDELKNAIDNIGMEEHSSGYTIE